MGENVFSTEKNPRRRTCFTSGPLPGMLPPVSEKIVSIFRTIGSKLGKWPDEMRARACPAYGASPVAGSEEDNGNLTLAHHTSYSLLSIPQLLINALLDSFSLCTYENTYPDPDPDPDPEPWPSESTSRMRVARARKTSEPYPRRRAEGETCKVPIEPSRWVVQCARILPPRGAGSAGDLSDDGGEVAPSGEEGLEGQERRTVV